MRVLDRRQPDEFLVEGRQGGVDSGFAVELVEVEGLRGLVVAGVSLMAFGTASVACAAGSAAA
jgi:hypothetical protein